MFAPKAVFLGLKSPMRIAGDSKQLVTAGAAVPDTQTIPTTSAGTTPKFVWLHMDGSEGAIRFSSDASDAEGGEGDDADLMLGVNGCIVAHCFGQTHVSVDRRTGGSGNCTLTVTPLENF